MTPGAAALVAPLGIADAMLLHAPMVGMLAALGAVLASSGRRRTLGRADAGVLLAGYAAFVGVSLLT